MKQTKRYISITKKSDTSITVIYHAMSLTVLYIMAGTSYMSVISDNVCFVLDQHAQLDFFSARTLKLKPVHMILILSQQYFLLLFNLSGEATNTNFLVTSLV